MLHGPGAAHGTLGVVGPLERRPEQHQDGVADELVDRPPALEDDWGHAAQVPVEQADHPLRAKALGQSREAAQVRHEDGHGPDLAAQPERAPVLHALLGQLGAHVPPQHVADEIAIAEPLHHLGHRPGESADLVPAAGDDGDVEVALADPAGLRPQFPEGLGDPPHEEDAASDGDQQRQQPEPRGTPRLRLDGGRVVALGHHHRRHPLPVGDRERRGAAEIPLPAPLERVTGAAARAQVSNDLADERGILPRRLPGGIDASRRRHQSPVLGRDEHAAPRRNPEIPDEPGQAAEGEVHREDPAHGTGGVEERHRARDPQSPVEEAVGLGPGHVAPGLGQSGRTPAPGGCSGDRPTPARAHVVPSGRTRSSSSRILPPRGKLRFRKSWPLPSRQAPTK